MTKVMGIFSVSVTELLLSYRTHLMWWNESVTVLNREKLWVLVSLYVIEHARMLRINIHKVLN